MPSKHSKCSGNDGQRQQNDEIAKAQVLVGLAELFGRTLSAPAQALMLEALADVRLDALNLAAQRVILSSKFMPSVAELREMAGAAGTKTAEQSEAHLAWERSCAWLKRWAGKLRSPESGHIAESHERVPPLDDRSLGAIRRLGGMTRMYLALGDTEQLPWVRRDFLQEYELSGQIEMVRQLNAADVKALPVPVRELMGRIGGE